MKKRASTTGTTQRKILFEYLSEHVATCSMVAEATGLKQKNLCYYKAEYEKANLLWIVFYHPCEITGLKAQWLTTNPSLIPEVKNIQLALFDGGELL